MLKVIIADETQESANALKEKLAALFPELAITTSPVADTQMPAFEMKKAQGETIMLQSAREVHFIPVSRIVRVTGENNYSVFTLENGHKITVARTLGDFEPVLCQHQFYRIHKSHIINLNYLVKVHKGEELAVLMSDGAALELASRRRSEFLRIMQERCVY